MARRVLRWASHKFGTIANNGSDTEDMLTGKAGKDRVIKYVTGDIDSDIYLRIYRDNDLMVDLECDLITTGAPLLPVNIPLGDGETARCGFYNSAAGNVTPTVAIGYEEND